VGKCCIWIFLFYIIVCVSLTSFSCLYPYLLYKHLISRFHCIKRGRGGLIWLCKREQTMSGVLVVQMIIQMSKLVISQLQLALDTHARNTPSSRNGWSQKFLNSASFVGRQRRWFQGERRQQRIWVWWKRYRNKVT